MIYVLLAILIFSIMIHILPPTVTVGDVAELVGSAATLGISHSPGYPLFCNIYKIFTVLLPFGDYSYRAAVASLILFVLSSILVFEIFKNYTSKIIFAFFVYSYFISQGVLIKQSIIGEVFALHNLIYILILYFIFDNKISFIKKLYIISLLLGLSFGNQHITVFIIPGIILWVLYKIILEKENFQLKYLVISAVLFVVGLCIYLYVPLRSLKEPLYDWEDPQTLDRFIYLFTRGRYGSLSLAQGGKLTISFENLFYGINIFLHIIGKINVAILLISFLLWISTLKTGQKFVYLLMLLLNIFFCGPFLISISGLRTISPHNVFILERLITTSVVSMVIFVGFVLSTIKYNTVFFVLTILNITMFIKNINLNSLRNNFFIYDYTINIFRNTPYESVLISDRADETEFAIAYYQRLLKKRNDIKFIDANASVTRSIYGNNYYKIWGQPRLDIRTKVETEIVNKNINRVLYNTVLPKQTGTKKYKFGLLHTTWPHDKYIGNDIFIIRNLVDTVYMPREFGLYVTYLQLLGDYYFNFNSHDDVIKQIYTELYLITKEEKYLTFIPYYHYSHQNYKLAEEEYNRILQFIRDKNTTAEILVNLGVVYEKMNQYKRAEDCYKKAIQTMPEYSQAYYNLGVVYWKTNKLDNAISSFQQYLKLVPYNVEVKKYIEILKSKN